MYLGMCIGKRYMCLEVNFVKVGSQAKLRLRPFGNISTDVGSYKNSWETPISFRFSSEKIQDDRKNPAGGG